MRVGKTILTALWLSMAVTTVAASSSGQTPPQAPPSNDGNGAQAARHYEDGVAAAKLSHWARAYESFRTAWKLKQHFQIAANLGRAELKLGKYRDAAEHLAYFLREAQGVSLEERQAAQAMLNEARAKVGAVTILVDRQEAEVLIDGVAVGKSPMGREVFVEPGRRTVEAKRRGFGDDRRSLDVAAGSSPRVLLTLSPSTTTLVDPATSPRTQPPPPDSKQKESDKGQGDGATETALIVTGIAGTAVAAGLGVASVLVAGSKKDEAQAIYDKCLEGVCETHDSPAAFRQLSNDKATFQNLAFWSFIGAGALGGATLIYALTRSSSKSTAGLTATVIPTEGGGGILVTKSW